jgi:hypothetical protein
MPDYSVKGALDAGELRTVLDNYVTHLTNFHILWPSARQMTPKVCVFVDHMTGMFDRFMIKNEAPTSDTGLLLQPLTIVDFTSSGTINAVPS